MSLNPCRECGHQVSVAAKTCPSCGTPHPANKAAAVGSALTTVGCALTLFVTVPIVFGMCFLL